MTGTQEDSQHAFRQEVLRSNQYLATTCNQLGFAGAVVCAAYVQYQVVVSATNRYLLFHLPLFYLLVLLFGAGWLLSKYVPSQHWLMYTPVALLLLADCILALLVQDIVTIFLSACWYVLTLAILPFFHSIRRWVHVVLFCLLQVTCLLALQHITGVTYTNFMLPVLLFTSAAGITLYVLSNRQLADTARQFQAVSAMRQEYITMQLDMLRNNEQVRRTVHDLRNPVASIQLFAEFMLKYVAGNDPELTDNLESILECCKQMNEALSDANISHMRPPSPPEKG